MLAKLKTFSLSGIDTLTAHGTSTAIEGQNL